jgi:acetyltransferase
MIRNLQYLFRPTSIAVIGASTRERSVGNLVMKNLLEGGFDGPIMPVNPNHRAIAGVLAFPDVKSLPETPDLAVVCTPPETLPSVTEQLVEKGVPGAVILTVGLSAPNPNGDGTIMDAVVAQARRAGMRLIGPNCLGLMVPGIGLNASFAHKPALAGKIAFVSQSGAMCTAVLDWSREHGIGFSHFISVGECADVGFGDVIDYLGSDIDTRAIMLYIESITNPRTFMSAARAAARNKPILVIKAGRVSEGAKAAASHTGAMAGSDQVFDAAIRRAGMLRVFEIHEIFAAVETLARARPMKGERLAIMTNGGGLGVLAVDQLIDRHGVLANLDADTMAGLDAVLPPTWSHGNPVDIIGDAPGERYSAAAKVLTASKSADALLVLHAPTATASSDDAATAVAEATKGSKMPVLTSWVGGETVQPARRIFREAGIPTFETPGQAVAAFRHMAEFRRNQEMLMETPPSAPDRFNPTPEAARFIIEGRLARNHEPAVLSEPESKAILAAYGIPTVETRIVSTRKEAILKAEALGYPVALKVLSDDITHKSDIGGVALYLETADAVGEAYDGMMKRITHRMPEAKVQGFTVQPMAVRPGAVEAIVGIANDPIFGPIIMFGEGGTAVEVIGDRAVALPPLNMKLARDLVAETRVSRLLAGYRNIPPADMDGLCLTLVQLSQIVIDIPEVAELDINPLLVDQHGVLALDARIRIQPFEGEAASRLTIRPYPKELEETFELMSGENVFVRPIRPEDEAEHYKFLSQLTPEDIRFRFFGQVGQLPHSQMARLTQIDYDREMAFIAKAHPGDVDSPTLGVVRTNFDPDNDHCEFAIVVRSDLKGQGMGHMLLKKMIEYCRRRGTGAIIGQILSDNAAMRQLARSLGFQESRVPGENVVAVRLELRRARGAA